MKKFFVFSLIFPFFFAFVGEAQPLYLHWTKFIGSMSGESAYDALQTADSGIVFVGTTIDIGGLYDIPDSPPDSFSTDSRSVVVGKLDSNKQLSWVKIFRGSQMDDGWRILQLPDGGFAVFAGTSSFDGDVTLNHGVSDAWLLRLDQAGNLLWQKTYGSSYGEHPVSFAHTSDNGFIMLGMSNGADQDIPFHYGGTFSIDWFVIKADSLGNIQWVKNIGGLGDEGDLGNIFEANNGYYIVSSSSSYDHDCSDSSWRTGSHTDMDYYMLKLDTVGNVLWSKSYGGSNDDRIYSAIWDERDSSIIISGNTLSADYMVQGNSNSTYRSIWVVKTDKDGNYLWGKRMGDTDDNNDACNIIPYENGGYLMSARCHAGQTGVLPGRIGGYDMRIFMLDSSGDLVSEKFIGGVASESSFLTCFSYRGGFATVGYSFSEQFSEGVNLNMNHSGNNINTDICISALFSYPDPLSLQSFGLQRQELKVYPNPSQGVVRILVPSKDSEGVLQISDSRGNVIYNKQYKQKAEIDISTAGWIKGIYVVEWISKNRGRSSAKLINN